MQITELQKNAKNGQEFFVYSAKGTKYKCRWVAAKAGLFKILERDGRPSKTQSLLDVKGAPRAKAEAI